MAGELRALTNRLLEEPASGAAGLPPPPVNEPPHQERQETAED
jgi:hypothetical protein